MKKIGLLLFFVINCHNLFATVIIKSHTQTVAGQITLLIYANTAVGEGVMAQARYGDDPYTYTGFVSGFYEESGSGETFTNFKVTISGLPHSGSVSFEAAKCNPYGSTSGGFEYTGFIYTVNDVLPVQLSSFNASVINKSVNLKWETATEQNNYGFEVERASNNDWVKIGFVDGSGNSNSPKEYSYTDNSLNNSGKYSYRLKQLDNDGSYEYSSIVEVDYNPVLAFELEQNYPNPFNPVTSISYSVVNEGLVKIEIYNSLGQLVAIPVNEIKSSGRYSVSFDASKMSSGTYIYKLSAGEFVQTKKMNLIK